MSPRFLAWYTCAVLALSALVFRFGLPVSFLKAFGGSLIANLCSTFLGVPLAWFHLVVAQYNVGGGGMWGLERVAAARGRPQYFRGSIRSFLEVGHVKEVHRANHRTDPGLPRR